MDQQIKDHIDKCESIISKWNEHGLGLPSNSRATLSFSFAAIKTYLQFKVKEVEELNGKVSTASDGVSRRDS